MKSSPHGPRRIVIVGGGTAGWMAASLLQNAWADGGTTITLIESSEIGIIGVGEGSTPYLRDFFRTLEISEEQWMPACHATYKCGISFPNWSSQKDNKDYFHPFFSQFDLKTGNAFFHNCGLRRRGADVPAHPNDFFVATQLASKNRSPIPNESLPFQPDYAYHFDAGLLGKFLQERAKKLGVDHIIDTVAAVKQDTHGNIKCLRTAGHGELKADLFLDCSGFVGLLIDKTLNEEFHSFSDNLYNDRAVAIPTPLDNTLAIPSQTRSQALKHGWAWNIPLTSRYGNGYVYASDFISEEEAERELRAHLGPAADGVEARHLKMRVGRVDQHWSKNCLAVGLSQGFIEPLEATALMLIQYSVQHFIELHDKGAGSDKFRAQFNNDVNTFFDGVRDYVVTHYQTNTREDSQYWIANRENTRISNNLAAILNAWDEGLDFEATLTEHAQTLAYLRPSWYCILAGMGRFPKPTSRPAASVPVAPADQAKAYCESMTAKFYDHREYLQQQTDQKNHTGS